MHAGGLIKHPPLQVPNGKKGAVVVPRLGILDYKLGSCPGNRDLIVNSVVSLFS